MGSPRVQEKREIPAVLKFILNIDKAATHRLCTTIDALISPASVETHYKALEISCHGILWLAGWLAFIWVWNSPSLYELKVNFFIGLILDIIVVAIIKALTRRKRPVPNCGDMFATISVDKFSFPSGHATRACFISYFFSSVYPVSTIFKIPLFIWASAVVVSRVLLRRHHILDALAGVVIGIMEGIVLSYILLGPDTCSWLLSLLTEEKVDGGEEI